MKSNEEFKIDECFIQEEKLEVELENLKINYFKICIYENDTDEKFN